MSLNFISTACMVNSQINRNQNLNLVVSGQCKFSFSMFNGSLSSFSLTFILFNVQESPFNMLVFIPSWNISAVLHIFFLIIPPLSSAQGYGCHSGFWNIFLEPYRFLSRPPSLCLSLSFEEQTLSISDILFSQGKDIVLCPAPTKLMSVSYQPPFFHTRLSRCITTPMFPLSHSISKKHFFLESTLTHYCNILPFTKTKNAM